MRRAGDCGTQSVLPPCMDRQPVPPRHVPAPTGEAASPFPSLGWKFRPAGNSPLSCTASTATGMEIDQGWSTAVLEGWSTAVRDGARPPSPRRSTGRRSTSPMHPGLCGGRATRRRCMQGQGCFCPPQLLLPRKTM
jgi:hypothetical protein